MLPPLDLLIHQGMQLFMILFSDVILVDTFFLFAFSPIVLFLLLLVLLSLSFCFLYFSLDFFLEEVGKVCGPYELIGSSLHPFHIDFDE